MAHVSLSIVTAVSLIQIPYWNLQSNFTFIAFFNYLSDL